MGFNYSADIMNPEAAAEGSEPNLDSSTTVFQRRIEFHLARKPYNGFSNNLSNGFKLVTLNPNLEPMKASDTAMKFEKSNVSENLGLDPELSFGITFRRIGAGLRNLGNTCFLNSVLQCLTYTEPLAAYLQSGKHQYSCRTAGFCALCAIQKHVSRALQSTGRILEPKDLVSNLRCISRNFRNARQEDAHEYMVNLLESMHKCCLPSGVSSESHTSYDKSLVHKIFGGRLRSQVKCMQCFFCSNKFDPFLDLSLEIAKADSLYKALAHFTAKEHLDGGAREYRCQECKQKVKALKQLTIHEAPHVLTIHLKRFGSHVPGQKIDKKISFSPTLDLKPFVSGPNDEDLSYTLYGVLVHAGWSTHSGHYYCFVRTSSGMWYSLDDNQVVQVNERKVLEQKAYMLFYVRDGKNFGQKKPFDVIRKENRFMNVMGNAAYSNINPQVKEMIQDRPTEKTADGSFPTALSDRDSLIDVPSSKTPFERISFQNINSSTIDYLFQKRDAQSEYSSIAPPVNDSVGSQVVPGSAVEASCGTLDLANATKSVDCIKGFNSPNCNSPKDSFNKKEPCNFVIVPPSSCCKDSDNRNPSESDDQLTNCDDLHVTSRDACGIAASNSATIVGSPKKSCDPTIVDMHEGEGGIIFQSKLSSSVSATIECLPRGLANNRKSQLRVKRKVFKCWVSSMPLSANIIFTGAFYLQKQKCKQKKSHSLRDKNANFNHLSGKNDSQLISGPSNPEKSIPIAMDRNANFQKEKAECCSNIEEKNLTEQNSSGNDTVNGNVINDKSREKIDQNVGIYTTEKPPQARLSADSRRESRRNGIMSILQETTVARWDGIDVFQPEKTEPRAEPSQIGYIGDEWDEEYDRGKRKKIRSSKISFNGPNLFQEIATRNAKQKRAKLDRSTSHPYRI